MSCQLDGKQIATIAVTTVAAGAAAYGIYHLVKKRSATSVDVPVIIGCSANIEKSECVALGVCEAASLVSALPILQ
jgi:malic enzyme